MSAYSKLNRRRQKFVDARVAGKTLGDASLASGYKNFKRARQTGYELSLKPEIMQAIEERKAEAIAEAGRTAIDVLKSIGEILDRCMQTVPVRDRKGDVVEGEFTFDAKNALSAAELLGDFHKLFLKRIEHAGPGGTPLAPPQFNLTFPNGGPGQQRSPPPEAAGPVLSE